MDTNNKLTDVAPRSDGLGLEGAIQRLLAEKPGQVLSLSEDDEHSVKVLIDGHGETEIIKQPRPPIRPRHQFDHLDDFAAYLAGRHCEKCDGVVFASSETVEASLAYGASYRASATLPLIESEEMDALRSMMAGIDPIALWTLCASTLAENFVGPEGLISSTTSDIWGTSAVELLGLVSNLRLADKTKTNIDIDASGLVSTKGGRVLSVRVASNSANTADRDVTLPIRWCWKGRFWSCCDDEFEVPLRLTLDAEKGLKFVFHAERIQDRMRTARANIVEQLCELVPEKRFSFYRGSLNG